VNRTGTKSQLSRQADRICAALMGAEIDMAFAFLRLAVAESQLQDSPRAVALVERAILAHKTVMRHVEKMPIELEEERCELERGARALLEMLISAERQFQILRGSLNRENAMAGARPAQTDDLQEGPHRTALLSKPVWHTTKREAC
jgi:hypothetical protein